MRVPTCTLDTPGWGSPRRLSAHNFREVAPEVLSPLSWSLIGAGMEAGFRELAATLGHPIPGGPPRFAIYVGYRPYHGMDAIEELLAAVPWMRRSDPWELLMGRQPDGEEPTSNGGLRKVAASGWRFVRQLRANGNDLGAVGAKVAAAELAVDAAVRSGGAWALGSAADEAARTAREAWALHAKTASAVVGAGGLVQRLLTFEYDRATARQLLGSVACRDSDDAGTAGELSLIGGGTEVPVSYELAPGGGRFAAWAPANAPTLSTGTAARVGGSVDALVPEATPLGDLVRRSVRLFRTCLDERERSKALALRALHVVRCLLPSGITRLDGDDAALLGVTELRNLAPREQAALIAERSEELSSVGDLDLPVEILERGGEWQSASCVVAAGPQHGTGLAPGWAEGIASDTGDEPDAVLCGYRVEAYQVLRVAPVAVVSQLGSLLSHVSIVCRELGIPMVTGVAPPMNGTPVVVDGWDGTVTTADG